MGGEPIDDEIYMGMIRVVNVLTLLSLLLGRCMVLYFNKRLAED